MINQIASHFDPLVWRWLLLPSAIFLLRICDVTLDTGRIIFIARGLKGWASAIGFFQVLVWLLVITQIVSNLTEVQYYLAYAAGFAAGNYIGIWLENRLALGLVVVRVITGHDATSLLRQLSAEEYGFTTIDAQGLDGQVRLILSVVHRKDLEKVVALVRKFNPGAFISVEDIRMASEGIFPSSRFSGRGGHFLSGRR